MWVLSSARAKRLIIALGVSALTALCLPAASVGQAPTQDSVTGVGTFAIGGLSNLTIDARSGPSGENPSGSVRIADRSGAFTAQVTCLHVTGNRAIVGFGNVIIEITDNGPSNDAVTLNLGEFATSESNCPSTLPQPGATFQLLTDPFLGLPGDFVVVDAPPLPTFKEQCKNGGWQKYDFNNQGQCVAFVNRGAPS